MTQGRQGTEATDPVRLSPVVIEGMYGDERTWPVVIRGAHGVDVTVTLWTSGSPGETFERVAAALAEAGIEVRVGWASESVQQGVSRG